MWSHLDTSQHQPIAICLIPKCLKQHSLPVRGPKPERLLQQSDTPTSVAHLQHNFCACLGSIEVYRAGIINFTKKLCLMFRNKQLAACQSQNQTSMTCDRNGRKAEPLVTPGSVLARLFHDHISLSLLPIIEPWHENVVTTRRPKAGCSKRQGKRSNQRGKCNA